MDELLLARADEMVAALRKRLAGAHYGLSDVPVMLQVIIRESAWRERVIRETGQIVRFERFIDFVTTPPLEGLGTNPDFLLRLCDDDQVTRDMLNEVLFGKRGAPLGNRNAAREKTKHDNVMVCSPDPQQGNSPSYALRRLRRERPDLHARVLAGELSPHRAMVEAGFRRRTITVPVEPGAAARALLRHFSPEEIAAIVATLVEDGR